MTLEEFRASLGEAVPPRGLPPLLDALWWDAKGDFDRAHEIAQDETGKEAAWVHAYLHRKQGDPCNADYWYHRAHQAYPAMSTTDEWRKITTLLLQRRSA